MLDGFMIEQLEKWKRERIGSWEQERVELPIPMDFPTEGDLDGSEDGQNQNNSPDELNERGVITIPMGSPISSL